MDYIFDLFGTLITDNIKLYNRIMSKSFGLTIQDFKDKIRYLISTKKFNSKEEALNSILNHLKRGMDLDQKNKFFSQLDFWKNSLKLHDGAIKVLKKLKKRGSKIGIVSNNNTFVEDVIKIKGVNNYTDIIIFSHEIGALKPDKKIYQACLNKLKASPQNVTMIGDQLERDILIPKKLGIHVILFDPNNKHPKYKGKKIKSLKELIE